MAIGIMRPFIVGESPYAFENKKFNLKYDLIEPYFALLWVQQQQD